MSRRKRIPANEMRLAASYAAERAAARSSPRAVTFRIRPPFVTKSSFVPGGSGVEDESRPPPRRPRSPRSACRRRCAPGSRRPRARPSRRPRLPTASWPSQCALGGAGERLEEVALEARQDRLRLRVAETAVELEHARSVLGEHQAGVEEAGERRAALRELCEHGTVDRVDELVDLSPRRAAAPASTSPSRRCSGPVSPSPTRLKSCAGASGAASRPSVSANSETSSPSSSSSITELAAQGSRGAQAGVELLLGPADEDALARREPVGLDDARRPRRLEPGRGRDAGCLHDLLGEALRAFDSRGRPRSGRRPRSLRAGACLRARRRAAPRGRRRRGRRRGCGTGRGGPPHPPLVPDGTRRGARYPGSRARRGATASRGLWASFQASACSRRPSRRRGLSRVESTRRVGAIPTGADASSTGTSRSRPLVL